NIGLVSHVWLAHFLEETWFTTCLWAAFGGVWESSLSHVCEAWNEVTFVACLVQRGWLCLEKGKVTFESGVRSRLVWVVQKKVTFVTTMFP
ncbi:hypothetical protein PIB30_093710, partial [Stylosanthes scabra]|nr:hypothetical protein [Stylosanthes scabra]